MSRGPAAHATNDPPLRITFFSLAHGISTLVQAPEGRVELINCGGPGDGPELTGHLKRRGISTIHAIILDNWAERCVGATLDVLKGRKVFEIIHDPIYTHTPHGDALFKKAAELRNQGKLRFNGPSPGFTQTLFYSPPCQIQMVGPTGPMLQSLDGDPACSLMMLVSYNRFSLFTLGETTRREQRALLKTVDTRPRARVVVVGRNGADNSLEPELLKTLGSKIAVFPIPRVGGHAPAPATLALLRKAGVKTYRTDTQGTLTLTSDSENISVKTER